jgi:hypothetical protein
VDNSQKLLDFSVFGCLKRVASTVTSYAPFETRPVEFSIVLKRERSSFQKPLQPHSIGARNLVEKHPGSHRENGPACAQ